jgi:hypothetical protein
MEFVWSQKKNATKHFNRTNTKLPGIAAGYGLDDRDSVVQFPAGVGNFSLLHRVQTGSVTHPASYPLDTRGSFTEVK